MLMKRQLLSINYLGDLKVTTIFLNDYFCKPGMVAGMHLALFWARMPVCLRVCVCVYPRDGR